MATNTKAAAAAVTPTYTAFGTGALEALTDYIKQVKSAATGASSDVASLRGDLTSLAEKISAVLQEIGGAISDLDSDKAYVDARVDFSLVAENWMEDEDESEDSLEYPYKYTLALSGVTADTRADAVLNAFSSAMAGVYGMSSVTETTANAVIFRSRTAPDEVLSGTLYVTRGETAAEETEAEDTTAEGTT